MNTQVPKISVSKWLPTDDRSAQGMSGVFEQISHPSLLTRSARVQGRRRAPLHIISFDDGGMWHVCLAKTFGQKSSRRSWWKLAVFVDAVDRGKLPSWMEPDAGTASASERRRIKIKEEPSWICGALSNDQATT